MNYKVGEKYLVDVAICEDTRFDSGEKYVIPIINIKHRDAAFGVSDFHYHIDCRFEMGKEVKLGFRVNNFKTVTPLWDNDAEICESNKRYKILEITKRELLCVSTTSGFNMKYMENPPFSAERKVNMYWNWYDSMVGKSCAGKKCPHYGTEMIDTGKRLICPMHNLIGDRKTETIIPYKKK